MPYYINTDKNYAFVYSQGEQRTLIERAYYALSYLKQFSEIFSIDNWLIHSIKFNINDSDRILEELLKSFKRDVNIGVYKKIKNIPDDYLFAINNSFLVKSENGIEFVINIGIQSNGVIVGNFKNFEESKKVLENAIKFFNPHYAVLLPVDSKKRINYDIKEYYLGGLQYFKDGVVAVDKFESLSKVIKFNEGYYIQIFEEEFDSNNNSQIEKIERVRNVFLENNWLWR